MQRIRLGLMIAGALVTVNSPGAMAFAQTLSWEQSLISQYPKGAVLTVLVPGIVGTAGCGTPGFSTFKDGKLHPPGFGQNLALATLKCLTQSVTPGTQVSLGDMKVFQKSNQVAFAVTQCINGDCSAGVVKAQVNFEFAKGFMAGAALEQIQEPIGHVFSVVRGPNAPPVPLPPTPQALNLPSVYVSAQTPADQLQLNADNSFALQEGGQSYKGTFVANGNTVELNISGGTKTTATIQGNNLTDSGGQAWVLQEQSAKTAPAGALLKNEDIVKMAKAGLDDALIIAKIGSSKCQFDTSTDALIQLKQSGVSSAVLKAVVAAGK